MKNYINTCILADWHCGKQIVNGELGFSKISLTFYKPEKLYCKEKIEIPYSEIIWIEKKNSYLIHPNKMTIFTKNKAQYSFVVNEREDLIEFLDSKVKYITEKPMEYKERLQNTSGEKIRRQYFNMPLYLMSAYLLPILVCFILSKNEGLEMLFIILTFLSPLLILSMLNRFLFGRIVCALEHEGVHCEHGLILWNTISNIEYQIEVPSRGSHRDYCYARLIGKEIDIKIIHAPYYFVKKVKKYNSNINVKFSNNSKFIITLFAIIAVSIFILFIYLTK